MAGVDTLFEALRVSGSSVSKVESAKQLGDLMHEAVRLGGFDDARTRALIADVLQRALLLARCEEGGAREAAATIIGLAARVAAFASHSQAHDLESLLEHSDSFVSVGTASLLSLSTFDVRKVRTQGLPLLAHSPLRYARELTSPASTLTPSQQLLLQRTEVLRVIGLSEGGGDVDARAALSVTDFSDLLAHGDVVHQQNRSEQSGQQAGTQAQAAGEDIRQLLSASAFPSRQRRAKGGAGEVEGPPSCLASIADAYQGLCFAAFDCDWHVRHGAVLSLQYLLGGLNTAHAHAAHVNAGHDGAGAGNRGSTDRDASCGSVIVQDAVLRCVALLALDRVGDFSGDSQGSAAGVASIGGARASQGGPTGAPSTAVSEVQFGSRAPIREAAAALLRCSVENAFPLGLSPAGVTALLAQIVLLCSEGEGVGGAGHAQWHARHGAALALRALLGAATRTGRLEHTICGALPVLLPLLRDCIAVSGGTAGGGTEDVSAVAATCVDYVLRYTTYTSCSERVRQAAEASLPPHTVLHVCTALLQLASDPVSPLAATVLPCAVSALRCAACIQQRHKGEGESLAGLHLLPPAADYSALTLAVRASSFVRHSSPHVRRAALRALLALRHIPAFFGAGVDAHALYCVSVAAGFRAALLEAWTSSPWTDERKDVGKGSDEEGARGTGGPGSAWLLTSLAHPCGKWPVWLTGGEAVVVEGESGGVGVLGRVSMGFLTVVEGDGARLVCSAAQQLTCNGMGTGTGSVDSLSPPASGVSAWVETAASALCTAEGDLVCGIAVEGACACIMLSAGGGGSSGAAGGLMGDGEQAEQAGGACSETTPMDFRKRALGCRMVACVLSRLPAHYARAHILAVLDAAAARRSANMAQYAALLCLSLVRYESSAQSSRGALTGAVAQCVAAMREHLSLWPITLPDGNHALSTITPVPTCDIEEVRPHLRILQAACVDLHSTLFASGVTCALSSNASASSTHNSEGREQKGEGQRTRTVRNAVKGKGRGRAVESQPVACAAASDDVDMLMLLSLDSTPANAIRLIGMAQAFLISSKAAGGGASAPSPITLKRIRAGDEGGSPPTFIADDSTPIGAGEVRFQLHRTEAALAQVQRRWAQVMRVTAGIIGAASIFPAIVHCDPSLLPNRMTGPLRALSELAIPSLEGTAGVDDVSPWAQAVACYVMAEFLALCWGGGTSHASASHAMPMDLTPIGDKLFLNLLATATAGSGGGSDPASQSGIVMLVQALSRSQGLRVWGDKVASSSTIRGRGQDTRTARLCAAAAISFSAEALAAHVHLLPRLRAQLMQALAIGDSACVHAFLAHDLEHTVKSLLPVMDAMKTALVGSEMHLTTASAGTSDVLMVTARADTVAETLLRAFSGLVAVASDTGGEDRHVRLDASAHAPALVSVSAVCTAYGPVWCPFIMRHLAHPLVHVRTCAMEAFRGIVQALPLSAHAAHAESVKCAKLTAGWTAALHAARSAGVSAVTALAAGARGGLSRLPLSIADVVYARGMERLQSQPPSLHMSIDAEDGELHSGEATPLPMSHGGETATTPAAALPLPPALLLSLRPYQVQGVGWLDFLQQHGLGGVLADDMGLGKTVQSLCAVATYAVAAGAASCDAGARASTLSSPTHAVSLVACPTTLQHHWAAEARRFFGERLEQGGVKGTSSGVHAMGAVTPSSPILHVVVIEGHHEERQRALETALRVPLSQHTAHTILVVSHGMLRSNGAMLARVLGGRLAYFILDEAHLACNAATALAAGVHAVAAVAAHRLALTGTPIQHGVQELWTAFSWLMPGYLGDASSFRRTVSSVVLRARSPTSTLADVDAARGALRTLHRALLPFILRRLKGDVLPDLPPRTLVDVLVDLAPAQRLLYDAFLARNGVEWAQTAIRSLESDSDPLLATAAETRDTSISHSSSSAAPVRSSPVLHVNALSAITTLRQICSHPRLVTDPVLAAMCSVSDGGKSTGKRGTGTRADGGNAKYPLQESCKLEGLLQLMHQLGIAGTPQDAEDDASLGHKENEGECEGEKGSGAPARKKARSTASQSKRAMSTSAADNDIAVGSEMASLGSAVDARKLLVFSQSTKMLDAVQDGLFKSHPGLRGVGFARLDGNTPGNARAATAANFNTNPSTRVLLLTTGVGGLGLSLVGADTVVFLDHDWNPSRDLQAMDRAHRLGQTRPVTVYRLLARGTLEERIMSVQRFKTAVASAVVATGCGPSDSTGAGRDMSVLTLMTEAADRSASHRGGLPRKDEEEAEALQHVLCRPEVSAAVASRSKQLRVRTSTDDHAPVGGPHAQ